MTRVTAANLRAFNVGFGDCLLLSITYDDGDVRHALIDFGSSKLPPRAPPSRMLDVAHHIKTATGGTLHMVVATHRHSDHISGFGRADSGKVIESMHPKVVLQPWTEHPDLDPAATTPVVAARHPAGHLALARTLANMSSFAAGVASEGRRLQSVARFPKTVAQRLEFLGETNLTNRPAVERLMKMGERHIYASFGDDLGLGDLFPRVNIEVLGPPTLEQQPSIAREAREDAEEFWHLAGTWGLAAAKGSATINDLAPLFADAVMSRIPQAAKWLIPQIERANADEMASLLRTMDNVLNNTSLILLIQIEGTTLLFPGDAQIENWSYALFDAKNSAAIRKRLADTRVYKVGHHGSLNATPKTLWKDFAKKAPAEQAAGRLISVVSTLAGKHGDARRNTEVPRKALVDAMKAQSEFHTTQDCRSTKQPWADIPIPITSAR